MFILTVYIPWLWLYFGLHYRLKCPPFKSPDSASLFSNHGPPEVFFFFFNWRLITLQYCSGFLPYIDMIQPWVYVCSLSWTPLPIPPHPIPQDHPSASALSTPSHVLNLDWRSVSHMIIYMFQCYSFKSSHPRLLKTPKDCSIHLCLFCCLAYMVIVTIFLDSIYTCKYTILVFFFLTYFTLHNRLQFHPPH